MHTPQNVDRLKPGYRKIPKDLSPCVNMPTRPSAEMKASASGTPAKLDATPQNDRTAPRIPPRRPPMVMAQASKNPISPPETVVIKLILTVFQYDVLYSSSPRCSILSSTRR